MHKDRSRFGARAMLALATLGLVSAAFPAAAQQRPVSLRDSVPIGSNGLCEAQIQSPRAGDGLFDRRYLVVCRDAAAPVGSLYVLGDAELSQALQTVTRDSDECSDAALDKMPEGLPDASGYRCMSTESGIQRLVVIGQHGKRIYAANGLSVYSDALRLGLASLATDRLVEGAVEVPLTQASDAQAFARAQAEAISAESALDEAYRRSNAGNFAEAAEFFAASANSSQGTTGTEAMLNEALQQSNLGNYLEAARLFAEAEPVAASHPLLGRLARNFEAIDALNRQVPNFALTALAREMPQASESIDASIQLQIDNALAERLAAEQGNSLGTGGSQLTLLERAQLLDGQASYIRAAAFRQLGRMDEARAELVDAQQTLLGVRDGRVLSILWLRAQLLADLAEIEERRGNVAEAEGLHLQSVAMLEANYPDSPALLSARAQLAGLLARSGREDRAIEMYRELVDNAESKPASSLRRLLRPYFELLGSRVGNDSTASDMFAASQLLLRPGLAQTQAVLARELSAGSDEASQLFRQAINMTRAIERMRAEVAQLEARVDTVPTATAELATKRGQLNLLQQRQLEVQQKLADYPRYRVVSDSRMDLASLQSTLRSGEAYFKLVMLDEDVYAIYAEPDGARAYPVSASASDIATMVDTIRDSIAIEQAGQTITYPFEIDQARQLYQSMFGPIAGNLADIDHLIFEPDGAMLRLPANLLVMDDASVDNYATRVADPAADPYDFRGTAWLGRAMQITTAVSPTSFRDVRNARASDAQAEYLGMGQNTPIGDSLASATGVRSGGVMDARCSWSPVTWSNPIQDDELRTAGNIVAAQGERAAILTDSEFTDTRLKTMEDLDEYRILHFATHGLVTSPQADCPPRPALLTSFGDGDSDGLLSFAEIFDLRLDADLVILSACNTASVGGLAASREAGITTGGDFALDGLVRAFVGAGGRTVVASHWPVPDDFGATGRLMTQFFESPAGIGSAEALRQIGRASCRERV